MTVFANIIPASHLVCICMRRLGASWGVLGASWGRLGVALGRLGALMGSHGGHGGGRWRHPPKFVQREKKLWFSSGFALVW